MSSSLLNMMDQGPMLQQQQQQQQQQLPLDGDHLALSSDHNYPNHQYDGHSSHHHHLHHHHNNNAYTAGGAAVNQLRRETSTPLQQTPQSFAFTATNGTHGPRFVPDRGVSSDTSSYQPSNHFPDLSSGSISTSPSSAASSLAYTNYHQQPQHCTTISSFPGLVQLALPFVPSYSSGRAPPILDSGSSGMLPPPTHLRSSISSPTSAKDCESYTNSTSYLPRTQLSPAAHSGYGSSFPDTPRTLGLTNLTLSNPAFGSGHMMASPPSNQQQNDCGNFPWPTLECHAEMTCDGQSVTPEIRAKVEKGFFLSTVEQKWTCYRRNYFSVQCSFELHPNINNGRMQLKRANSQQKENIQAMGMRLSAAVDGSGGKVIELIQHTPKRDSGPKIKIEITKVSPAPTAGRSEHTLSPHGVYQMSMSTYQHTGQILGPSLPFQNNHDASSTSSAAGQIASVASSYGYQGAPTAHLALPGQNTTHQFERVQFKQATANNGKRRATQQYFHLIVELFADVRKSADDEPQWVKVAHRVSEKIVVRGRSPSHYQNEGQHQNGRTGSTSGGSGYSGTGGPVFGGLSSGAFRNGAATYGGGLTGANYRTNTYGHGPSPDNSGSSASSVDGGADNEYSTDYVMSETERSGMQAHDGYRYYPAPIFEGHSLPPPNIESGARYLSEPSQWKYESPDTSPGAQQWAVGGVGRFHGLDTSRGYYPDLATTS